MDDCNIIKLYINRDEQALAETTDKYSAYCRSISYNILRDIQDTEECMNDVLVTAWNSIPPQKANCLKSFLGKLTRNHSLDMLEKRNAQNIHFTSDPRDAVSLLNTWRKTALPIMLMCINHIMTAMKQATTAALTIPNKIVFNRQLTCFIRVWVSTFAAALTLICRSSSPEPLKAQKNRPAKQVC